MNVIVFASDHFNTLGVLRCLAEKDIVPTLILVQDSRKSYLVDSSNCVVKMIKVGTIPEGYTELLKLLHSSTNNKPVVLTGMDRIQYFLDSKLNELKDKCYLFNSGVQGRIGELMNKFTQNKIAAECNLNPIQTRIVCNGDFDHSLNYPVLTKAIDSEQIGWKDMVHICKNEMDLKLAYSQIDSEKLLLQNYIDKENELAIMGISYNDGNEILMPLELKYMRSTEGAYGTYNYLEQFSNEALKSNIQKFFKKVKYNGIFEIEFLIDKNKVLWFLEVNFRISCWVHGYCDCGFNMPYIYAKACVDGFLDSSLISIHKTPFFCLLEPSDFMAHVLGNKDVSLWQWIKDFRNADAYYFYDKKDPKPFYKMIYVNLLKVLKCQK